MSLQQLTDAQKTQVKEFKEPGPFSIVTYCEALLKPSFYGEELCIILLSMLLKVRITIFDGDSLVAIKVRHTNTPFNADVHLVHVPNCWILALTTPSDIQINLRDGGSMYKTNHLIRIELDIFWIDLDAVSTKLDAFSVHVYLYDFGS